mgnify:FL=1
MTEATIVLFLVYLLTILLAATETIPLSMSALIGALLIAWFGVQYGVFTYNEALHFVDMRVIGLIVGTMVVVEVARKSDVFHFIALYAVKLAGGHPARLFVAICVASAAASLFLSDSTAMLLMAAAVITISKLLEYDPLPYFLSSVIMINLGGTSTLIGSVSNMIIGIEAGMSFTEFINYLTPCEIALWILMMVVLYKIFKPQLGIKRELPEYDPWRAVRNRRIFIRSALILCLMIALFLTLEQLNISPEAVALGCAIIALLLTGIDPAEIFRELDWETIFFVTGFLFIVNGLEKTGFLAEISRGIMGFAGNNRLVATMLTLWFSGLASTIVSNIAVALTFAPIIKGISDVNSDAIWSALVLGTNLGGATIPFSSTACAMAIGALKREGIPLSFSEFTKIGVITTVVQLVFASLYLIVRFNLVT